MTFHGLGFLGRMSLPAKKAEIDLKGRTTAEAEMPGHPGKNNRALTLI
jgi:hypothetical protein